MNKLIIFMIVIAIFVGVTIAYLKADMPFWIFAIGSLFGILFLIPAFKTKLIIEDGMLSYKKLGSGEEVDLKKVSQILTREIELIVNKNNNQSAFEDSGEEIRINDNQLHADQERQIPKNIYILDGSGRTIFQTSLDLLNEQDLKKLFMQLIQILKFFKK